MKSERGKVARLARIRRSLRIVNRQPGFADIRSDRASRQPRQYPIYASLRGSPASLQLSKELMDDDEFRELQTYLLEAHDRGDTISHTGGCRKIRWSRPGMGKRSGVRVIYYVRLASGRLYLLLIYPKNAKDDLSEKEKAVMKALTQQLK